MTMISDKMSSSLFAPRLLTPETLLLWPFIHSASHGSLEKLTQRSKGKKTLNLWESWISLVLRISRSEIKQL